jgi:recombination protein RecR
MVKLVPAQIQNVVDAIDRLPGIGPKAAWRHARRLLTQPLEGQALVVALQQALAETALCCRCRCYTVNFECPFCTHCDTRPDCSDVCLVVEQIDDLQQALDAGWQGRAFVLHGLLSPLDGIGPMQLGLDHLDQWLRSSEPPLSLVIALPTSVEGRTSAHYLSMLARRANITSQVTAWQDWLERESGRPLPDTEEKS